MPYFRIMLHGHGLNIPAPGGGAPITGFHTSRLIEAASAAEAEESAKRAVAAEWSSGPIAASNIGSAPTFEVESVTQANWLTRLFSKTSTNTFYRG
jgi:hypothetical protein